MKPIYQRFVGQWGRGKGDCAWAALASIFEEPLMSFGYDKLEAPCDEDLKKLTECRWPHLEFHREEVSKNWRLVDASPTLGYEYGQRWHYDPAEPEDWEPPADYWLGTVFSQRLKHPEDSSYYGMPGLHAVVMHGREVAHDPNPQKPYEEPLPLVMMTWWTLR